MRKSPPDGSVMDAQCPSRLVLDRIADKWTALIIQVLANGTKRYAELQREIGGISQKMLTQTLRSLERDGLVQRKVHPVVPPKVEYSLTKLGRTLIEPLHGLCRWSEKHLAELQANRARAKGSAIGGQRTADRTGLDSTVTLLGATPDGKLAIVRDSTGKTAHVKFANLGVQVIDGVRSTVKGWARAKQAKPEY